MPTQRTIRRLARFLDSVMNPGKTRIAASWAVLAAGLALWLVVQGVLVLTPLWSRCLPPEADDSLAYLVRTKVMDECFGLDCPALRDLDRQLHAGSPDPEVRRQLDIANFPFPFYHPIFSLILLAIGKLGYDPIVSYKIAWSLSPLLFGVAFGYLLCALWGRFAAGIALALLAFKVFPDTGLQYLTPSNLSLAAAVLIWARIISKRGSAPLALIVGSVILTGIHPIGLIYAIVAILFSIIASPRPRGLKIRLPILSVLGVFLLTFVLSSIVKRPSVINALSLLSISPHLFSIFSGYASNVAAAVHHITRLKDGLFGPLSFFFFSVSLGFVAFKGENRAVTTKVVIAYAILLLSSLLHTHELSPPADLFYRIWIPMVVILYGSVGYAIVYCLRRCLEIAKERLIEEGEPRVVHVHKLWPVMILALLSGYALDMSASGLEQIMATAEFSRNRQPLAFDSEQPRKLLACAKPGDKVLYIGTMPMAFHFLYGTMQLGAVYYHPALSEANPLPELLRKDDLRFAVVYNPTVYHPTLEGLDEKNQCISTPEYRYSPLSNPRRYGSINREGWIAASEFKWIQVTPKVSGPPGNPALLVANPGKSRRIECVPVDGAGNPLWKYLEKTEIPAKWNGWIRFSVEQPQDTVGFRILLPKGDSRMMVGGVTLDEDNLNWPWRRKAQLTLHAKDAWTGEVSFSFDPADILPSPLNALTVNVIDDRGASALFEISR